MTQTSFERIQARRVARGEQASRPRTNEQSAASAQRNASLGFGTITQVPGSNTNSYSSNTRANTINYTTKPQSGVSPELQAEWDTGNFPEITGVKIAQPKVIVEKAGKTKVVNAETVPTWKKFGYSVQGETPAGPTPGSDTGGWANTNPPATPPQVGGAGYLDQLRNAIGQQTSVYDEDAARRAAAEREAQMRASINEGFNAVDATIRQDAQRRAEALAAGLGISQGLNYSTTNDLETGNINRDTQAMLSDSAAKRAAALSSLSSSASEKLAKELSDMRSQRLERERQLNDSLYKASDLQLRQAAEDRAATNAERDDARSVATNILNNFAGADLESLPASVKSQLAELEKKAGYPAGFISEGLRTLKELKQQQANEIASGNLNARNAELELRQAIAELNAAVRAPAGVTISIPGLNPVTGVNTPSSSGGGGTDKIKETYSIVQDGKQIGMQQVMTDGTIRNVDMSGNPLNVSFDPRNTSFIKVGSTAVNSGSLSDLRAQFGLPNK